MQDIRERELEIVDQTQTPRYVLRFEPLLYVPASTQKDFHYVHRRPPTKGTSTEEFAMTKLEYTAPLTNTTISTQEASPLHKRDGHKAKTTITSTQEG